MGIINISTKQGSDPDFKHTIQYHCRTLLCYKYIPQVPCTLTKWSVGLPQMSSKDTEAATRGFKQSGSTTDIIAIDVRYLQL